MIALKWIFIGMLSFGALANVYMIDKERKPITRGMVVAGLIINAVLITYLLYVGN